MTVEILHDALTLLPGDLVAAVEERRSRKRQGIRWHRLAAMAACFALVFCAGVFAMVIMTPMGGSTEKLAVDTESEAMAEAPAAAAPAEDAPMEATEENGSGSALTQESAAGTADSQIPLAPGFLEAQWLETPYGSAVNHGATPHVTLITGAGELEDYTRQRNARDLTDLRDHKSLQEEDWFSRYDLVLISLPSVTEPELSDIQETETGWTVVLGPKLEGEGKSYHLLLTVEKGLIPNAEAITVAFA